LRRPYGGGGMVSCVSEKAYRDNIRQECEALSAKLGMGSPGSV